jgi:hypothetical protein
MALARLRSPAVGRDPLVECKDAGLLTHIGALFPALTAVRSNTVPEPEE